MASGPRTLDAQPIPRNPSHFAGFDGLRARAAVLVGMLHTSVLGFFQSSPMGLLPARGDFGVTISFPISGLLLPHPFGRQDRSIIRRFLLLRPIAAIGGISCGIHLWHLNLRGIVLNFLTGGHRITLMKAILCTLAASIVVASISYFVVEKPALRLNDRLPCWKSTPLAIEWLRRIATGPVLRCSLSERRMHPQQEPWGQSCVRVSLLWVPLAR